VGKSLFRYAPEALPHEILNNFIPIHWPTFSPLHWPTFSPALTPLERTAILRRAAALMIERREELAALVTIEMGNESVRAGMRSI
jgi:hypothetical protein